MIRFWQRLTDNVFRMNKVVISFNLVFLGLVDAGCPLGWLQHGGKCYWFSHEALNWYDAQSSCHAHNAVLAEIRDTTLNEFLKYMASTYKHDIWLGGRDDIYENHWRWSSNGQAFSFTDWYPGEPNNVGGKENCLELHAGYSYRWNDDNCHDLEYFICEK